MLKRLREKLKKRWRDLFGRGRVPTTYEKKANLTKTTKQK